MSTTKKNQSVFVLGCSRSGTTLLQSILSQHPRFESFPETNILYKLLYDINLRRFGIKILGIKLYMKLSLKAFINKTGFSKCPADDLFVEFLSNINREDLYYLSPGDSRSMKKIFNQFHEMMNVLSDGSSWVEKTPQHIFCIDYLQKHYPTAYFIHIVRDGKDNIASLIDAASKYPSFNSRFGGANGLKKAIAYWNNSIRISEKYKKYKNHSVVRYEDIISNPLESLSPIEEFLNITFNEQMLKYKTKHITLPKEKWKEKSSNKIFQQENKYMKIFNNKQRELISSGTVSVDRLFPRRIPLKKYTSC